MTSWPLELLYTIPAAKLAPATTRARVPIRIGDHDVARGEAEVLLLLRQTSRGLPTLTNLLAILTSFVARELIFKFGRGQRPYLRRSPCSGQWTNGDSHVKSVQGIDQLYGLPST